MEMPLNQPGTSEKPQTPEGSRREGQGELTVSKQQLGHAQRWHGAVQRKASHTGTSLALMWDSHTGLSGYRPEQVSTVSTGKGESSDVGSGNPGRETGPAVRAACISKTRNSEIKYWLNLPLR